MPLVKKKLAEMTPNGVDGAHESDMRSGQNDVPPMTHSNEPTDPTQRRISRAGIVQAAGQVVSGLNVAQYVEQPTMDAVMAEVKKRTRELAADWLQFVNE